MSLGATQVIAVAVNVLLGLMIASWADFSPWLGPLAMYALVVPALFVHFGCGAFESHRFRTPGEFTGVTEAGLDEELQRIRSAGHHDQHRVFLESRIVRERVRRGRADPTNRAALLGALVEVTKPGGAWFPHEERLPAAVEDIEETDNSVLEELPATTACPSCGNSVNRTRRRCPRCATEL